MQKTRSRWILVLNTLMVEVAFGFFSFQTLIGQDANKPDETGEQAEQYAFDFLNLDSVLPKQYAYRITMDGVLPRKETQSIDSATLTYEGYFDVEADSFRQDMNRVMFSVEGGHLVDKTFSRRIKIKSDLYEQFSVQKGTVSEPSWAKVSAFYKIKLIQTMTPYLLPVFSKDFLSNNGPSEDLFAHYLSKGTLAISEETPSGVRGTWVNKSGGQLVFKMQMFFDKNVNYLPTEFLQTVHDGKLSGDELLKDKGRLASDTRTTWKKYGDNMLLPSHVESTISRNLDPDEYQTWKIDVEWKFGKDANTELIVPPAKFTDEIQLRKKLGLKPAN